MARHHVPPGPSFCGYRQEALLQLQTVVNQLYFIITLNSDIIELCSGVQFSLCPQDGGTSYV